VSGPILLFGADGQLGREFLNLATRRGVDVVGMTRAEADISDADAVARAIDRRKPRLIVNAAAYTAVDKAEANQAAAEAGNVAGPAILANAATRAGIPIVHFSTDYVFDGTKKGAYREDDPIAPLGVYGRTKAAGEAVVRDAALQHVIVRTAWVYGVHGNNFLKTMMRLGRERDELRVVGDQKGCPTSTLDLAEAILAIDRVIAAGGSPWGTYHFAGQGSTTWHGFASEIIDAQAARAGRSPAVVAIATSEYPTPAKRPANSELDSKKFSEIFGYTAQPWRARTRQTVDALIDAPT
jgi:dTDP-4-dehydrorhamnose reductase